MSGEPNFSVDFTARVLGTEGPVAVGDALVYDPTYVVNGVAGIWRIASSSNRSAAGGAGADAIALTAYGGSVIGSVSYQASGVLPAEISGLPALAPSSTNKLVRTSTTGRLERIDSYTAGDDVIGYARWNGRVALHIGLPWDMIAAIAGGGGATPAGVTGDIQVKQDATTFNVVGFWTAQDNAGTLRATYWDPVDGVTLRSCIEVSGGGAPFWPSEQYPSYGLFRLADSFHSTGGWSFLTVHDGSNTRGLLGLSLGNYFVGDSTGNIPTTIYGLSVQIVAGSGGASVQGGLKVGTLSVGTGTLATTGAVNFGTTGSFYFRPSGSDVSFLSVATTTLTLGIAAGTLALKHKTTSQLGADTGVTTTDAFDDFARVQTTDATTTSLYTFTLPTNAVTTIDIRVTACKSDTSSADAWVGTATFKNAAGTVATVAAANITHRGSTAWTVTIDNSTTTARVRVTGAAATTIEWAVEVSYQVTRQS